jgi:hypothetical protein
MIFKFFLEYTLFSLFYNTLVTVRPHFFLTNPTNPLPSMTFPEYQNVEKDLDLSVSGLEVPKQSVDDFGEQSVLLSPKEYKRLLRKIDRAIVPYITL